MSFGVHVDVKAKLTTLVFFLPMSFGVHVECKSKPDEATA